MTTTGTVLAWIASQIPYGTATLAAISGSGLQEHVWRDLAERGPVTVHELIQRLDEDHERVRNALYRLLVRNAVKPIAREPSPRASATRRVVWAAVDRDGNLLGTPCGKQWI